MTIAPILPELTPEGAERLSGRISARLDAIADNYVAVMPLIREALNRNAFAVLGYNSPGAYVKDRFGDALAKLAPEVRREVVKELSNAGMSTRAIAPVVGMNHATVSRDIRAVAPVADATPVATVEVIDPIDADVAEALDNDAPSPDWPEDVNLATGELPDEPVTVTETHTDKVVTGLDGKTYQQKPREPKPVVVGDFANRANAVQAAKNIGDALATFLTFSTANYRARILTDWWPLGKEAVLPANRDLFNPAQLREIAGSLEHLATEMEQQNV
jgi:hypothetical protein